MTQTEGLISLENGSSDSLNLPYISNNSSNYSTNSMYFVSTSVSTPLITSDTVTVVESNLLTATTSDTNVSIPMTESPKLKRRRTSKISNSSASLLSETGDKPQSLITTIVVVLLIAILTLAVIISLILGYCAIKREKPKPWPLIENKAEGKFGDLDSNLNLAIKVQSVSDNNTNVKNSSLKRKLDENKVKYTKNEKKKKRDNNLNKKVKK